MLDHITRLNHLLHPLFFPALLSIYSVVGELAGAVAVME